MSVKIQNTHFLASSFPLPSIFQSHISGYNLITSKWLALAISSWVPTWIPLQHWTDINNIHKVYSGDAVISTLQMKWNVSYSCFLVKHKNSIGALTAKHHYCLRLANGRLEQSTGLTEIPCYWGNSKWPNVPQKVHIDSWIIFTACSAKWFKKYFHRIFILF